MRKQVPAFPELEKQILVKGLLKREIASGLGIAESTLSRKLTGKAELTLKEICYLHKLLPDISVEVLFGMDK